VQDLIGSCARGIFEELQREAIPEGGWADVAAQVPLIPTDSLLIAAMTHAYLALPHPLTYTNSIPT
jgi:hypothetical protein